MVSNTYRDTRSDECIELEIIKLYITHVCYRCHESKLLCANYTIHTLLILEQNARILYHYT
jgi:hypothetical protein